MCADCLLIFVISVQVCCFVTWDISGEFVINSNFIFNIRILRNVHFSLSVARLLYEWFIVSVTWYEIEFSWQCVMKLCAQAHTPTHNNLDWNSSFHYVILLFSVNVREECMDDNFIIHASNAKWMQRRSMFKIGFESFSLAFVICLTFLGQHICYHISLCVDSMKKIYFIFLTFLAYCVHCIILRLKINVAVKHRHTKKYMAKSSSPLKCAM